jgi:AbiV family abortive infection protein
MVNLKKISKIAELSFSNALKLHFDSVFLFNNKSYSSAYFLSVLAQEEIGKYYLLDDFAWHSTIDGRYDNKTEKDIINQIFNHSIKQKWFIMQGGLCMDNSSFPKKFIKDTFSYNLERNKQNTIYVGLPKHKGKVNFNGKIINPFTMTKNKCLPQITIVSDYFIDYVAGILSGYYSCENENLEKILNNNLLEKLTTTWLPRGKMYKNSNALRKLSKKLPRS